MQLLVLQYSHATIGSTIFTCNYWFYVYSHATISSTVFTCNYWFYSIHMQLLVLQYSHATIGSTVFTCNYWFYSIHMQLLVSIHMQLLEVQYSHATIGSTIFTCNYLARQCSHATIGFYQYFDSLLPHTQRICYHPSVVSTETKYNHCLPAVTLC